MNAAKLAGLVLIALGTLVLAYGGFSYRRDQTAMKVGDFELKVEEKKTVDVPKWAGIAAIVAGALILVVGGRKT